MTPKDGERPAAGGDTGVLVAEFEAEIARQEDLLYGVALFFEGLRFLFAGQEAMLTTYRKELRNIIQMDRMVIDQANSLLEQVRRDPTEAALIRDFRFRPCQGHPRPDELCRRALLLVESYMECFPDRLRSAPLRDEEIVQVLKAASARIDLKAL